MKRLGTCAVLLSMIAAVVVSAGYLCSVRMQRVVPATVPPDERIFRARLLFWRRDGPSAAVDRGTEV